MTGAARPPHPEDVAWARQVVALASARDLIAERPTEPAVVVIFALRLVGLVLGEVEAGHGDEWPPFLDPVTTLDPTMVADVRTAQTLAVDAPDQIASANPRARRLAALFLADLGETPTPNPEDQP